MFRGLFGWVLDRADTFANWLALTKSRPKYQAAVDVLRVFEACRWTVVSLIAISILLLMQSQGRDALLALLSIQHRGWGEIARIGLFISTVALWAIVTWYLPRLRLYFWSEGSRAGYAGNLVATLLPRLLGSLCFVVAGASTWGVGAVDPPRLVPILLFVLAPAFYVAAAYRRLWLSARAHAEPMPQLSLAGLFGRAEIGDGSQMPREEVLAKYTAGFLVVTSLVVLWALVMIALWVSPVVVAQWIGAPSAALLAASFWTTVSTGVGVLSDRTKLPLAGLLVVWAVAISPLADNHVVEPRAGFAPPRPGVDRTFEFWLDGHKTANGDDLPVFFAYAEGGGIRAAYFTAAILGELADENPAFADRLFAVSGISGGSWGATVYTGVRAWVNHQGWARADVHSKGYGLTVTAVHEVLRHDFLSPVLAGLLIRDSFQWFLPLVHLPDRGRAFEQAWEDAWRSSLGEDTLAQSFFALRGAGLPHLFLGATWAERGQPIVISDLTFPSRTTRDFFETFGHDLKASTAAHLSSRFPVFNPPATVAQGMPMHLVDGGYYENSGAETLMEVIDVAVSTAARKGRAIRPVVIAIHNDAELPDEFPSSLPWAPEVSAPLATTYHVKDSNTRRAEDILGRWRLQGGATTEVLRFNLGKTRTAVPLGWSLSEAAMEEMDGEIVHHHKNARDRVKALLRGAAEPLPAIAAGARGGPL